MHCPQCKEYVSADWIQREAIEVNDTFACPECGAVLKLVERHHDDLGEARPRLKLVDDLDRGLESRS